VPDLQNKEESTKLFLATQKNQLKFLENGVLNHQKFFRTKEFLKRNGQFTINIALVYEGKCVVGVIVVPAK